MSRKVIGWSIAAIVAIFLILNYLPSFVANSLYKNVDDLTDGEMPATVTAFQSGPDVVSTLGGSGEGLNCSLPRMGQHPVRRQQRFERQAPSRSATLPAGMRVSRCLLSPWSRNIRL